MNSFNERIAYAKERDWAEGAKRMRMEKRMASALVKAILRWGYSVTIDNGEAKEVEKSRSYREIMGVMAQTDEEHVVLYDEAGKRHGWFFLVYGNDGWDLVADYGVNDVTDAIWNQVLSPLADKLEAGG